VGLLAGGVPAILATLGWRAVRDAGRLRRGELAVLAMVGASALFCAVSSF
jgi:hypothetical protein